MLVDQVGVAAVAHLHGGSVGIGVGGQVIGPVGVAETVTKPAGNAGGLQDLSSITFEGNGRRPGVLDSMQDTNVPPKGPFYRLSWPGRAPCTAGNLAAARNFKCRPKRDGCRCRISLERYTDPARRRVSVACWTFTTGSSTFPQ